MRMAKSDSLCGGHACCVLLRTDLLLVLLLLPPPVARWFGHPARDADWELSEPESVWHTGYGYGYWVLGLGLGVLRWRGGAIPYKDGPSWTYTCSEL